jgi:archaellum component FlaC
VFIFKEIETMDIFTTEAIVNLGIELTKLAIKGTATSVATRITSIKNEKNIENIRQTYDEIINELIQERDEAVRIAQSYKSELEHIVISDKDTEHLHNTISRLLEILKTVPPTSSTINNDSGGFEVFEQLKELISIDTLKTMQLLGFNYKAAIGEPLTILCANAISSLATKHGHSTDKIKSQRR